MLHKPQHLCVWMLSKSNSVECCRPTDQLYAPDFPSVGPVDSGADFCHTNGKCPLLVDKPASHAYKSISITRALPYIHCSCAFQCPSCKSLQIGNIAISLVCEASVLNKCFC